MLRLGNALAALQKFNCDRLVPYMDKAPAYCKYAWAESKSGIKLDLINNSFAEGEAAAPPSRRQVGREHGQDRERHARGARKAPGPR